MTTCPTVLAFVLAGGEGSRLHPLTSGRCKPAVIFGRRYRLVDFVLSNLVNSGIGSIALVVQHKPQSLVEHVQTAWSGPAASRLPAPPDITVLPPPAGGAYRGTADAVFQNIGLIRSLRPDLVAVFGADHIYRMDVRQMIDGHLRSAADASLATIPVERALCGQFGIVATDGARRVRGFREKPAFVPPMPGSTSHALASMGNYLFDAGVLLQQLQQMQARGETDFGHHLLPSMVASHRLVAYDFAGNTVPGIKPWEQPGYWRDVGTVDAYYRAHFDTQGSRARFSLLNPHWPIHGHLHHDPSDTVADGRPGAGGIAADCIVMNGARVSPGARLRRTIVDEDNDVPPGERIGFDAAEDRRRFVVTEGGVVVVPAGYFARRRSADGWPRRMPACESGLPAVA